MKKRPHRGGSGIALGIALGVAIGVALGNVGVGIALGVAFGAAFDASRHRNGNSDAESDDQSVESSANMEKIKFSVDIQAPKGKVWNTLWDDTTFRDWSSLIDEGTYMVGEMKEGAEVQFISSVSGYGVTSMIEKLIPEEFVLFRHMADTKESGKEAREKEWTGGAESYSLAERGGVTTLSFELDAPPGQVVTFKDRVPQALKRVKELAETE